MKRGFGLIIILILALNSAGLSLISTNYCSLNLNEYIECFGLYSYKCEKTLCSKNKTECNRYKIMNYHKKLMFDFIKFDEHYLNKYEEEKKQLELFSNNLKHCEYKFKADEFCLNGKNCTELKKTPITRNYIIYKVDCKCPASKTFKCGQYCTKDSVACDYYKSNAKIKKSIKKCGNENNSTVKPFFSLW